MKLKKFNLPLEMEISKNNQGVKRKFDQNHSEIQNKSQKNVKSGKPTSHKQQQFRYGNYENYYHKRYGQSTDIDIRIRMLQPYQDYFTDKKVLDIGCNCGEFSIELAKTFQIKSLLGIDIDGHLIEKARTSLSKSKTEQDESIRNVLSNLSFRKANYILDNRKLLEYESPQYDVILCLSLTKWIHLNYGDEGIKFMFKRIFRQLHKDGVLVLEAQAFETYKKRSKICPEMLENYRSIELKPEHFESFLLSEEIGFSQCWCINVEEGTLRENIPVQGFRRNLQMFVKRC